MDGTLTGQLELNSVVANVSRRALPPGRTTVGFVLCALLNEKGAEQSFLILRLGQPPHREIVDGADFLES